MQIYDNSPEAPGKGNAELYFKFSLLGAFLAVILIGSGKLLIYLFGVIIKYWIWVIGILIGCFLIRHFLFNKKKKDVQEMRIVE